MKTTSLSAAALLAVLVGLMMLSACSAGQSAAVSPFTTFELAPPAQPLVTVIVSVEGQVAHLRMSAFDGVRKPITINCSSGIDSAQLVYRSAFDETEPDLMLDDTHTDVDCVTIEGTGRQISSMTMHLVNDSALCAPQDVSPGSTICTLTDLGLTVSADTVADTEVIVDFLSPT